jgi:hypothetical protein
MLVPEAGTACAFEMHDRQEHLSLRQRIPVVLTLIKSFSCFCIARQVLDRRVLLLSVGETQKQKKSDADPISAYCKTLC